MKPTKVALQEPGTAIPTGSSRKEQRDSPDEGEVIVTVVCANGTYMAGTSDASAMANAVLTPEQIQLVDNGETVEARVDVEEHEDGGQRLECRCRDKGVA